MKKFIKITLSLVLAVILLATAIPIYAVEDDSIKEVEELREENVKHFEMPDGTFKAIVYSEPVHRKDADGKWQDIDNTLSSEKENGNTNYSSFDGRIKFSKNIKNANGKILELSENGYKISFSLIDENIKSTSADVKNHKGKKTPTIFDSEREKLDKLQSVDNLTKISYNNIKKGIDIEYEIYANNIKESIIVNSKQSDYVYKFELKLNKLLAILNEDGSISLIDEKSGEEKYTMPAPFMFDDDGELSTDVYYTLTQNGKYKYELTVTADEEWINDSGRNFPVTIDPTTVYVSTYYGEAYVSSANPNTNYCKPNDLMVGTTYRTFMKFEMPELGIFPEIIDATLNVKYYYSSTVGYMNVGLYVVPYAWNENTITWNNSIVSHSSQENSALTLSTEYLSAGYGITSSSPADIYFDLTTTVRDWCKGMSNNGVAIKYISGSSEYLMIKGYNSGSDFRSTLEITYTTSSDVTVYVRNAQSNKYMQNENTTITSASFDGDTNQRWHMIYLGNGYYKIISYSLYGMVLTAPTESGDIINLTSYIGSDNQMWSVTKNANGQYKLSPKSNPLNYISALGTDVKVTSPQLDNKDEWIFYEVSVDGMNFEYQQEFNWCWIACARIFATAFIDDVPSQNEIAQVVVPQYQSDLDRQIGNYDIKGSNLSIESTLNFIFGSIDVQENSQSGLSEDLVMYLLDRGIPIIAFIQGKHYVVIYEYDKVEGENKIEQLYIYDPLDFEKFEEQINDNGEGSVYPNENDYCISYDVFSTEWTGWLTIKFEE